MLALSYIQIKVNLFFFKFLFVKIYASTMIFNPLYEIKFSLVILFINF